jgi:hypothetical protein
MYIGEKLRKIYWWLPFCLYAADANAWGLMTHVYFAHSLLWAMPLLDPRLQKAIKRFPELVMTGACLPDLAVVSRDFHQTHVWDYAHDLLNQTKTDEDLALAIGFASHLYIDVIAHHHFVPAHEGMWLNHAWLKSRHHTHSLITHISSEWAMDAHLTPLVESSPSQLLKKHKTHIVAFICEHLKHSEAKTVKAINRLAFWDNLLRKAKIPQCIYRIAKLADENCHKNFIYYIAKTQTALSEINLAFDGATPLYEPEQLNLSLQQKIDWREMCLLHLHHTHPQPITYFQPPLASNK